LGLARLGSTSDGPAAAAGRDFGEDFVRAAGKRGGPAAPERTNQRQPAPSLAPNEALICRNEMTRWRPFPAAAQIQPDGGPGSPTLRRPHFCESIADARIAPTRERQPCRRPPAAA